MYGKADLCITEFTESAPDPNDSSISLTEYDVFGRPYRLSIRYRRTTGKFELYKYEGRGTTEKIILTGTFEKIIESANYRIKENHILREMDKLIPCDHDRNRCFGCKVNVNSGTDGYNIAMTNLARKNPPYTVNDLKEAVEAVKLIYPRFDKIVELVIKLKETCQMN